MSKEVLDHVDESRRSFVKQLILGSTFVAPAIASFSMLGISSAEARHAFTGNMTTANKNPYPQTYTGNMTIQRGHGYDDGYSGHRDFGTIGRGRR